MEDKTILNVEGMTCSNCALGISRFLEKQGLHQINVDFASGEVVFEHVEEAKIASIITGINNLGYTVIDESADSSVSKAPKYTSLQIKFIICAIFTFPLLLHMFLDEPIFHNSWFQLILTIPVFLIGLLHFGKSAWSSLKSGVPNMDVLVTTGATAAFVYSIIGIILYQNTGESHNYLFFETSATIITLVLMGNIIEKRSIRQTTSALTELVALQPQLANKISIGQDLLETVQSVPVASVKKNDAILVNTGGVVPVDGKVYWGNASLDESTLTGESIPVFKETGSPVMAGSIVQSGTIKVVCEKTGNGTVLSNIIQLVKEARQSKPEIQKLGDKISGWFVPAVIAIAIITFIVCYFMLDYALEKAIMNAIAVLVISCPCAMGLATPTAVAVGLGKAAKAGIIIKGGATLEVFDKIKIIVFDKTGTLTTGAFHIRNFQPVNYDEQDAINVVYSLEQHSSHPLALSLVRELTAKATGWISFSKVSETHGSGLEAIDEQGNTFLIGSFASHRHLTEDAGHTIYLSKNNKLIATIDLADELKSGVKEMVDQLKNEGYKIVLLSGDTLARCNEVGSALNMDEIYSGQLPHQKTEVIQRLKKEGGVMMIGDGINDAPSLAMADLGVSFGDATKIAVNSAQVILLGNNAASINEALKVGKQTLVTIKQNLFWAFLYNVVAIPVAAMGFLSPMVAALSMAFSDVIVIGNSIRLKFRN